MNDKSFSLQIGSLLFTPASLVYIVLGLFLLGVLMGLLSIIHIDNPNVSSAVTMLLLWMTAVPIGIVVKGALKARSVA